MNIYRKKLIEVALPLEEINIASAREKSIRHGHPSTLHLWWARRPLATCRAIIFSSIIDDPGEEGIPQGLLDRIDDLPLAHKYRFLSAEEPLDDDGKPLPTVGAEREKVARRRRYQLFTFIERLVQWENSNDEDTLKIASELIQAATEGNPPPLLDPFCGGGSIPLEGMRLGLEAHGSDLNPVAVLITKAMIEIPSSFSGIPPVNPVDRSTLLGTWKGAQGLAEDVRYYGQWVRQKAEHQIGHLYPRVALFLDSETGRYLTQPEIDAQTEKNQARHGKTNKTSTSSRYQQEDLTVIAWIWARTVPSPDPVAQGAHVPLVRSFWLSMKEDSEAWVEPVVDSSTMTIKFEVRTPKSHPGSRPQEGTIGRQGGRCLLTGSPMSLNHVRKEGKAGRMSKRLMAFIVEGTRGRVYLSPSESQVLTSTLGKPGWKSEATLPDNPRDFKTPNYGIKTFGELFTDRQLVTLTTLSDLIAEVRTIVLADAISAGLDADRASQYANAISVYLSFARDKVAEGSSSLCTWSPLPTKLHVVSTFGRQALPMVWDYAESNPFGGSSGNFTRMCELISKNLIGLPCSAKPGYASQRDARVAGEQQFLYSTDPPYFDNIGYADLSDFFYIWLRRSLSDIYPDLFATVVTPKSTELIATPYRHDGSKEKATQYFEAGLQATFRRMRAQCNPAYPVTIYYAFKQSETEVDVDDHDKQETASTGWESMLHGLLTAGFVVDGTWPVRTERSGGFRNKEQNALASSIVLVCRARSDDAPAATRREFVSALRKELRPALTKLTLGNIAPVDLAQAAIGPGMSVFSRYSTVLESDGKAMQVRTALGLINQAMEEALSEQEGWYDTQTRWAVTWFMHRGFQEGPYGEAETLATAKDTPVGTLVDAGIIRSGGGKVKLLARDELLVEYDPVKERRTTIWSATQRIAQALDQRGELGAAKMMRRFREERPEFDVDRARELAYRLYAICDQKRWTQEARVYNALVLSWSDIEAVSQTDDAIWSATLTAERPNPNPILEGFE